MSLKTWKAKYYRNPADSTFKNESAAVQACIDKWEGFRPCNLKKHKIRVDEFGILLDGKGEEFHVDASTCALCVMHKSDCNKCVLFESRGGLSCSERLDEEKESPYDLWLVESNPKPMIAALREALKLSKEGK